MLFTRFSLLTAFLAALTLLASSTFAADWNSCADDLDRLRRAARDASDKANEVKSKFDELESCKQYPDEDFTECRSKTSDYKGTIDELESELSTVNGRVRSVHLSCEYDLGSSGSLVRGPDRQKQNRMCNLYRSYKDTLPIENLPQKHAKTVDVSDADCQKCLAG